MAEVALTEKFLAEIAGWEAMKESRVLLAIVRVSDGSWNPPSFDPWWNPAVEDQATGRSHRIGQTRIVTSYKWIAADTVEQKILQLKERKRQVIQGTLIAENSLAEALTLEDFQRLFEED